MYLTNCCELLGNADWRHIMFDWRRHLGEEFEPLSRFLLPTDELSTTYPATEDSYGCEVQVHEENGRYIGTVPRSRYRVEMKLSDILVHQFDLWRLRKEMCDGFGMVPLSGEIMRWDHTVPWGNLELEKGVTVPITLFIGGDYLRSFRERVMDQIFEREAVGEIVFTANRFEWDGKIEERARQHKILLVPFDEVVQLKEGKFLPTPQWDEYMITFYQMVEMDLPSTLCKAPKITQFEFRKKGQMWVIHFHGHEMFLRDGVGPQHISVLLSQPNKSLYAVDLQILASKQDLETTPRPQANGEMSDLKTIQEVERQAKDLLTALDTARREGNSMLESEIEDEINQLKDYLCQVKGLGGEIRKSSNPSDSIRRSVQQMIKRTIDTIHEELPDCARHLSRSIRTGFVVNYNPEKILPWVL